MYFSSARLTGSQSHFTLNFSNESSITPAKRRQRKKSNRSYFGACLAVLQKRSAADSSWQVVPCVNAAKLFCIGLEGMACELSVCHGTKKWKKVEKALRGSGRKSNSEDAE